MKTFLLICAACWLGLAGAWADLTVVEKIEDAGQNVENTSMFKGTKARVDASPSTSLILDVKTGGLINLMHVPKTYVRVASTVAQPGQGGAAANPKLVFTATGRKDTISGFPVNEYTCAVGTAKITLWLTKALPEYELALKEMSGVRSLGPLGPLMLSSRVDVDDLPGFPVRVESELPSGETTTRTLVSVSTKPLPDSEFEIPADYRELAVPVLTPPAAAQGSPAPRATP